MAQVFKFKFQGTVRRWAASNADSTTITFIDLESKIREFFQLPLSSLLAITYVDRDNDIVTVANDQDLIDACIVQGLSPLRLDVAVVGSATSKEPAYEPTTFHSENPCLSAQDVRYEDRFKGLESLLWNSIEHLARHPRYFKRPPWHSYASGPWRHSHVSRQLNSVYPSISYGEVHDVNYWRNFNSGSRNSVTAFPNHQLGHPILGDKSLDRGHRQRDAWTLASVRHRGIGCDNCGISPIEGPRYKSIKQNDLDLCEKCFMAWGNPSDYVKFDQSDAYHASHRPPPPPHHAHYWPQFLGRASGPLMAPPISSASFSGGAYGGWHSRPVNRYHTNGGLLFDEQKYFDAQFVKDVTVFDGTELAPGTRFTKIWRFSNVGILPWPHGTQLLHIDGDLLGSEDAFILELPEIGVPCGEEVDVSIDLVAPEKAGRYLSHWCLSTPLGQCFGHRVWVVIQVISREKHLFPVQISLEDWEESIEGKNMDLIEEIGGANIDTIDVNPNADQVMVDDASLHMDQHNDGVNRSLADKNLIGEEDVLLDAVVDGETVGAGQALLRTPGPNEGEIITRILCPDLISGHTDAESDNMKIEDEGFSLVENPNESTDWFDVSGQVVDEDDGQKKRADEDVLLHHNSPILHTCKLESTVDGFMLADGWNRTLEILEEMGFADKHTNVRLLMKNNGSLKQTVRELVKLEKQ